MLWIDGSRIRRTIFISLIIRITCCKTSGCLFFLLKFQWNYPFVGIFCVVFLTPFMPALDVLVLSCFATKKGKRRLIVGYNLRLKIVSLSGPRSSLGGSYFVLKLWKKALRTLDRWFIMKISYVWSSVVLSCQFCQQISNIPRKLNYTLFPIFGYGWIDYLKSFILLIFQFNSYIIMIVLVLILQM